MLSGDRRGISEDCQHEVVVVPQGSESRSHSKQKYKGLLMSVL